jgi:tRNA 2-thiouridine synthesizing protein A
LSDATDCFTLSVDLELDAKGLRCPMPLLKAKQALRDLAPAAVLRVLATDAGSVRDFQAYANISGIELFGHEARDGVYCYLLRKPLASPL